MTSFVCKIFLIFYQIIYFSISQKKAKYVDLHQKILKSTKRYIQFHTKIFQCQFDNQAVIFTWVKKFKWHEFHFIHWRAIWQNMNKTKRYHDVVETNLFSFICEYESVYELVSGKTRNRLHNCVFIWEL